MWNLDRLYGIVLIWFVFGLIVATILDFRSNAKYGSMRGKDIQRIKKRGQRSGSTHKVVPLDDVSSARRVRPTLYAMLFSSAVIAVATALTDSGIAWKTIGGSFSFIFAVFGTVQLARTKSAS